MPFKLIATLAAVMLVASPATMSASQASFNGTSVAVQQAFMAVQSAGRSGGNVTALVAELNTALVLLQKASAENSTDPAQAASVLNSALGIVQGVQASAATVAQQGQAAGQLQFDLSVGSAAVIVAIAVALYVYGDRIYRRLWLQIYGGHVVKKVG